MKRMIKSATSAEMIPAPFNKYYRVMKDQNELDAIFGPASQESVVEQIPGYDMKHIAWCIAQDWCFEGLSDNSIDVVELVSEAGGPPFLAYVVNDRVYPVSLEEVEMCCPDEDDF